MYISGSCATSKSVWVEKWVFFSIFLFGLFIYFLSLSKKMINRTEWSAGVDLPGLE